MNADLAAEPDGWRSANLTGRLPNGAQFADPCPAGRSTLRLTDLTDAAATFCKRWTRPARSKASWSSTRPLSGSNRARRLKVAVVREFNAR